MVVEGCILLLMIITATTKTVMMIIGKKYSSYDSTGLTRENYDDEININNFKYN